ncbi:MAG: hypothetical protein BGN94_04130 [Rhizobiales bacterium 68-8]|nr:MAG: hypothetical protein BGN94_04130 [Rhizobiales bacterium 68-8]
MPISGRLMTSSIRLPIHIEAIRPQNSAGCSRTTSSPGWMPCTISAPAIIAISALPGMPSVSSGMKEVCAPALLAASGPATPSTAPWPNSCGRREIFFSTV